MLIDLNLLQREIDVKFMFCMSDDQSYESIQHVTDEHHDFEFCFADQDNFDVATTKFLKLRSEIENADEIAKKTWPLQEVSFEYFQVVSYFKYLSISSKFFQVF